MHPPSPWIEKFTPLIPKSGPVLDVACGSGRHSLFLLEKGYRVVAVDLDIEAIASVPKTSGLSIVRADLEKNPWPIARGQFTGIVVVNYLWRPLFPDICRSLAPGGVLLYDTFARGNEKYGRPRNPDFLLKPGELKEVLQESLEIIDFFDGYVETPSPACRQMVAARRPA